MLKAEHDVSGNKNRGKQAFVGGIMFIWLGVKLHLMFDVAQRVRGFHFLYALISVSTLAFGFS